MKKFILFSQLLVLSLLSIPYLYCMDAPSSKDERLHKFVTEYINNFSSDITKIDLFIVNAQIDVGQDPSLLYVAINHGCLPLVKLLIKHGASPFQLSPNGSMLLQIACQKARNQNDENDLMQIRIGKKKAEYKKVFLCLLKYALQHNNESKAIPQSMLDFASPLANEYQDRELIHILEGLNMKK